MTGHNFPSVNPFAVLPVDRAHGTQDPDSITVDGGEAEGGLQGEGHFSPKPFDSFPFFFHLLVPDVLAQQGLLYR